MTTNRKMAGGSARRTREPRNWARPPGLALLGLALLGLFQAGCRSSGCSDCNIGQKISNGVQALASRVTRHFDNCGGGADCGCGGETVVDSGVPVISGGMIVPQPGTIIQQGPSMESPPTQLEAIPPAGSQPTSGTSSTPGATRSTPLSSEKRSSYTALVPPNGTTTQSRGSEVARALHSSPDSAVAVDPLDNLPPVDLSPEITKKAASAAKPVPVQPTVPAPVAAPTPAPTSTTPEVAAPTPAEKVSAAEGAIGSMPAIDAPSPFQAPGIRRYASVAPSISGGSSPSIPGLEWLKEKGCRTFIDLRKPSEVEPTFVDAVNDRNMVYISLPIVATRLDSSRLARFDDLISQSENRPVYFCDIDGTRAGLAWYIHLRSVVQDDPQTATGKAEEIGLTETEVKLAEAYLAVNKPRPRVSTARVAMGEPPARNEPNVDAVAVPAPAIAPPVEAPRSALPGGSSAVSGSTPHAPPAPSTDPTPPMLPGEDRPQASNGNGLLRDPATWRPIAALILTGIGVPLAYWSRSAFSVSRSTRVRASLPGAVLEPSDAPVGSDA